MSLPTHKYYSDTNVTIQQENYKPNPYYIYDDDRALMEDEFFEDFQDDSYNDELSNNNIVTPIPIMKYANQRTPNYNDLILPSEQTYLLHQKEEQEDIIVFDNYPQTHEESEDLHFENQKKDNCCCFPSKNKTENIPYKKNASTLRLLFVTMCFCALQCCWSLQIALLTPYVLEMGLPKIWVTIVWLCGPISGIIVQPIVGIISDRCRSRLGRRRPFILIGTIILIFALLFIPNSLDLGYFMGDTQEYKPAGLTLTIIGFWVLDIANNILQGPCRALISDIATDRKQAIGNTAFTIWIGIGNILGYVSVWVDFSQYIPMYQTPNCHRACINLKFSFYFAIILVIICVLSTLIFAKEQTLDTLEKTMEIQKREEMNNQLETNTTRKKRNPIIQLGCLLIHLPKAMKIICLYQFLSWIAWFSFLVYISDWIAENVFKGKADPQSPAYHLYENGVRFGSFGLAGFSALSLIVSPFIPRFSREYGVKVLLFVSQALLSIQLLLTLFVTNKYYAVILISSFGISYSVTNNLPFAITANLANDFEKGAYMGILNVFIVIPQILMAVMNPLITVLFEGNVAASLVAGAISSLLASVVVWFIIVPKSMRNKKKRRKRKDQQQQQEENRIIVT
ncbi:hypothetical protein ABK040_014957 [Willaertia magna]